MLTLALRGAADAVVGRFDQLEFVHRVAGVTSWVWDIVADKVKWFGDPDTLLGLAPGRFSGRFGDYLMRLHPADRDAAKSIFVQCLKGRLPSYRTNERLVLPDGRVRWIETFGCAEYGANGAVRMAGLLRDATDRREAEKRIFELTARLEEQELAVR